MMHSVRLHAAALAGGGPPPPCHHHPVPDSRCRVHGRPHVQQRELVVLGVHLPAVIVVDDVAHVPAIAVYNPVVAVERHLIAVEELFSVKDYYLFNKI